MAEWRLPGPSPQAYAVYVDDQDQVWVSDFGANALVRFDPSTETFTSYPLPGPASNVRQILGRPGEVWGAASALDQLVVIPAADPTLVRLRLTRRLGASQLTSTIADVQLDDAARHGGSHETSVHA